MRLLHNAGILSTISGEMQCPGRVLGRVEDHSPFSIVVIFCQKRVLSLPFSHVLFILINIHSLLGLGGGWANPILHGRWSHTPFQVLSRCCPNARHHPSSSAHSIQPGNDPQVPGEPAPGRQSQVSHTQCSFLLKETQT